MRISELVARLASDDRPTILAPGRAALSGARLHALTRDLWAELGELGCRPGHRVAVVGPSTAETAVILLTVCGHATAAPLNPALTASELHSELRDLGVDLVLAHEAAPRAAVDAAQALRTPWVYYGAPTGAAAGAAQLRSGDSGHRLQPPRAGEPDRAFVLHTSGTTAKPKTVPLVDDPILLSARNIADRLALGPGDRALSIMPLFHVHALGTVLLPTLVAGGSIYFGENFESARFFQWLEESGATWYSAVPSIHHTVLARARAEKRTSYRNQLRFVRSSSAPLPARLFHELEDFFGVPVVESYGMTEVEQICSGELPPAARKPGSVGRPGGPEVIVTDEAGRPVATGVRGEVCVRGANVFPGYEEGPAVNASAFVGPYFRTGDVGRFDEDGFLWLLGRDKDSINRGGEKISPGEVEDVMAITPGVLEAAAFAVPNPLLGEVVGAAVVVGDAAFDVDGFRQRLSEHLARFKVPERVWVVESLPRGPTGKLLRHELRRKLAGDAASTPSPVEDAASAAGSIQDVILPIWRRVSDLSDVGPDDAFLDVGGDSLMLSHLFEEVEQAFDRELPISVMTSAESVRGLATMLEDLGWRVPA